MARISRVVKLPGAVWLVARPQKVFKSAAPPLSSRAFTLWVSRGRAQRRGVARRVAVFRPGCVQEESGRLMTQSARSEVDELSRRPQFFYALDTKLDLPVNTDARRTAEGDGRSRHW
jgi:hypothetical protein